MIGLFVFESGYMIFSFLRRQELRAEMALYIRDHPREQGTVFSFHTNNGKVTETGFQWESELHEFRYAGKMYDVVRLKQENGKLVIHALSDQQEDQLMLQIGKQHRQKQRPSLLQLISVVFIMPADEYRFTQLFSLSPAYPAHPDARVKMPALEILSPPPELV
jgi:hypothetical protein